MVTAALEGRFDELEPRLATTLGFLRKLTATPWETAAADIAPMRAAGLSDAAIEEATRVAMCFNIMDRLADAFDYKVSQRRTLAANARILVRIGYSAAVIPGSPQWSPKLRDGDGGSA